VVVLLLVLWVGRRLDRPDAPQEAGPPIAAEPAPVSGRETGSEAPPPPVAEEEATLASERTADPGEESREGQAPDEERPEVVTREDPTREPEPSEPAPPGSAAQVETARDEPAPAVVETAPTRPEDRVIEGTRAAAGERLALRIEALRQVRVSVLLDGVGHPRRATLSAGQTKTWKADTHFLLSADDAGAIRLRLSGEDLGLAGADGERLERVAIRPSRP
jgi:hypothetical protein